MLRIYKITHTSGKDHARDLLGLFIVQSSDGFYVIAPEPEHKAPRILAESTLFKIPGKPPLMKFKFKHDKWDWDLEVDEASPFVMRGTWSNPATPREEPDTWVASGTGAGDPVEEEAQAAAAKYGQ
jgi:hypothetical protein